METISGLALASAAAGQAALVVGLLLVRSKTHLTYLPMAGLFAALFVIVAQPVMAAWSASLAPASVALLLPAYLLLGPLFWLYVVGLTQATPWQPSQRDAWHFLPVLVAAGIIALAAFLPAGTAEALMVRGDDRVLFAADDPSRLTFAGYLIIVAFGLILLWLAQSAYYMFRVLRRLIDYRQQLKALFASNERRELTWVVGVVAFTAVMWLLAATALVLENFFDVTLFGPTDRAILSLAVVSLLAMWALRQKPGFAGRYLSTEQALEVTKYERSALDSEHSTRIAQKLEDAMRTDQLFLQPGLTLSAVATHLGISPNYVSQTLNETLGQSFFDFVNQHRVEAAKPMLLEGDNAIVDIAYAVGFNARSSFYTAFKRATGQTPGLFRKLNRT